MDTTKQGFSKGFYQDTKEYLGINGFRHLKDTNYISNEPLTLNDITKITIKFSEELDYVGVYVKKFHWTIAKPNENYDMGDDVSKLSKENYDKRMEEEKWKKKEQERMKNNVIKKDRGMEM